VVLNYISIAAVIRGLGIHSFTFGSNGYKTYVEKPQMEKFTRRERKINTIKSIVQPKRTTGHNGNPHIFAHTDGLCINENYQPILDIGNISDLQEKNVIQLNHYYYRSEEEFREKCDRYKYRNALDVNLFITFDEWWAKEPPCNEQEDLLALQHKESAPPE
jgi:hypothetical protein